MGKVENMLKESNEKYIKLKCEKPKVRMEAVGIIGGFFTLSGLLGSDVLKGTNNLELIILVAVVLTAHLVVTALVLRTGARLFSAENLIITKEKAYILDGITYECIQVNEVTTTKSANKSRLVYFEGEVALVIKGGNKKEYNVYVEGDILSVKEKLNSLLN